ncbi:lipopolysaccharide biosynthesis protein [Fictibacillus sp. NRS-1165]|uniref:lipopolysaccharide biosynthesis protein n=1 Tax=Fictibacillus sp. NRS-1165 TaxID=3144463 RepID=UPI003D1DE86F
MNINQRKAGILLSYTLTVINALVGFVYIPLLIHFLGKSEYGLYQLMGSFLIYLSLFDFGLSNTVTRYYSKYLALNNEKGKENLLALSIVIYLSLTIVLIIVGIIFYFFLEQIFNDSLTKLEILTAKKMYIIILITAAVTIATSVFNAIINANERFVFLKGLSIVQTIMRPLVVYAVFSIEASALIVVIIQAIINISGVILKIYYSFRKLNVKIRYHHWDKNLFKEMLRYSFFVFITALMDQIFWNSDQVILGILVGTSSVAVYSIGSQIVMYYMTLSTAMSGVFLPSITKSVTKEDSNKELTNTFIKVGRLQFILLGAVLSGFILFGKEFIFIWVGHSFSQAYYIILILIIPFTIDLIQNIGLTILQAKNLHSFRAIVFLGMSVINIIASIPLAIKYGGIGTAFATGIAYLIGNGFIMNFYYYQKAKLDIFLFWYEIGKISIPIIIATGIGIFIDKIPIESQILSLIIKISIYLIIYISLVWRLSMNNYEKILVLNPLKKVINFDK